MNKFAKVTAMSLAVAMLLGSTAFAAESDATQETEYGETYTEEQVSEGGQELTEEETEELLEEVAEDAPASEEGLTGADLNNYYVAQMAETVASGATVTFTSAYETARLVQLGYSSQSSNGPISVTKGTLKFKNYWWWETKDIYLVCCSGTDTNVLNQSTNWFTDLLSGFEFENMYVKNIRKVITENIPAGSNIIITGHSLGGMVAQQIASDSTIKDNYNVLNTVTFGSPLIDAGDREGMVKRLGDTSDIVPYASVNTMKHLVWQTAGLNREDGGYSVWDSNFSAHRFSYQRADVWGAYDPCGEKNAGRSLTLDFSTTAFYHSPIVVTE